MADTSEDLSRLKIRMKYLLKQKENTDDTVSDISRISKISVSNVKDDGWTMISASQNSDSNSSQSLKNMIMADNFFAKKTDFM